MSVFRLSSMRMKLKIQIKNDDENHVNNEGAYNE